MIVMTLQYMIQVYDEPNPWSSSFAPRSIKLESVLIKVFAGAEPSLEEAVAVATQELSLSATQESSTTEAGLIQSDDGKSISKNIIV